MNESIIELDQIRVSRRRALTRTEAKLRVVELSRIYWDETDVKIDTLKEFTDELRYARDAFLNSLFSTDQVVMLQSLDCSLSPDDTDISSSEVQNDKEIF